MKGATRSTSPIASEIPIKIARGRYSCNSAFIITSLRPKPGAIAEGVLRRTAADYAPLIRPVAGDHGRAMALPVPARWPGTADKTWKILGSIHGRGTWGGLAQRTMSGKSMLTA